MIFNLDIPVTIPWTKKTKWETFGDTYDLIDLEGKHISEDLRQFLTSLELKPAQCSKFTVFPNKTQTIFVDSPWCEVDNHARIFWVDAAPIKITWFDITEPLGLENIENLFGVKESTDDDVFTSNKPGWVPKKEILVENRTQIVNPGEIVLLNCGVPMLIEATTEVRSKVYSIGFERTQQFVMYRNGLTLKEAHVKFESYIR